MGTYADLWRRIVSECPRDGEWHIVHTVPDYVHRADTATGTRLALRREKVPFEVRARRPNIEARWSG